MPIFSQFAKDAEGNRRKREASFLQSRGLALLLIFFLFLLVLAFVFGDRGVLEIVRIRKEIRSLQEAMATLEMEKARLVREIELLRANPLILEQKARQDLWLMKANEKVVVLVPERKEKNHE